MLFRSYKILFPFSPGIGEELRYEMPFSVISHLFCCMAEETIGTYTPIASMRTEMGFADIVISAFVVFIEVKDRRLGFTRSIYNKTLKAKRLTPQMKTRIESFFFIPHALGA